MGAAERTMGKIAGAVLFAALVCGCTYGIRGGASTLLDTSGALTAGGSVTAGAGLGDEGSDALRGVHATTSLYSAGYDAVGDGAAVAFGAGLEYFQQAQGEGKRLGFRAGFEAGAALMPTFDAVLFGASLGARYALAEGSDLPYLELSGMVGPAIDLVEEESPGAGRSGLVGIFGLSLGWLSVSSLRL